MGRLDWKRYGRFNANYETTDIMATLRGRQAEVGERVQYYRFSHADSSGDDLYDEGTGQGKVFIGPYRIPALHVIHSQGGAQDTPQGLYAVDNLSITASFDALRKMGFSDQDIDHRKYLTDRVVYDDKVFRVMSIAVLGQIQNRDIIVSVECVQVNPDELVNDAQFARWSQPV
ncbi:hypothetical protein [Streptomyces sp. NPDC002088]|uniref:hypothetical protein n=1 Tax=Streptomyces sp. NPDC002088 TaxID=3154665 RepID=UPI003333AB15